MKNQLVLITEDMPGARGEGRSSRSRSSHRRTCPTRGERTHRAAAQAREALRSASRRALDREEARRQAREAALLAAATHPRLPHTEAPRRTAHRAGLQRPAA